MNFRQSFLYGQLDLNPVGFELLNLGVELALTKIEPPRIDFCEMLDPANARCLRVDVFAQKTCQL